MRSFGIAMIFVFGIFGADTTKDDKKDAKPIAPISVNLDLQKPEPVIPVRFSFSITLPSYCISSGLDSQVDPIVSPTTCAAIRNKKAGPNVDDLIAAFAKDTQYIVQKGDSSHLLFFCAAKFCDPVRDKSRIRLAMFALAKPTPRYFQDVPVPANVKPSDLADAVATFSKGVVTGHIVANGTLRLETDTKLGRPAIDELLAKISETTQTSLDKLTPFVPAFTAERLALPAFCIAKTLSGPAPSNASSEGTCDPSLRLTRSANASDIALALSGDAIKVTADTPSSLIISCGAATCDSKVIGVIEDTANTMARPKPAYVEDVPVLARTSGESAAKIARWSDGRITADIIAETSFA